MPKKYFSVTETEKKHLEKLMSELAGQLARGEVLADPVVACHTLKKIVHPEQCILYGVNKILRLVSEGEILVIDACDGTGTFKAKDGFTFVNDIHLGEHRSDRSTTEREVEVYGARHHATNVEIFKSVGIELDELCLTEHQGANFLTKYYQYLPGGEYQHPIIFLRKKEEDFYVTRVFLASSRGHLTVREDRLFGGKYLPAGSRVILPKFVA